MIDGIFARRGVGTNALGAVNLVLPFTVIVAVRIGQGNVDGANKVFRQGMVLLIAASVILSAIGLFCTDAVCSLLGAEGIGQLATPIMTLWINRMLVNMIGELGVDAFAVISCGLLHGGGVFWHQRGLASSVWPELRSERARQLKILFPHRHSYQLRGERGHHRADHPVQPPHLRFVWRRSHHAGIHADGHAPVLLGVHHHGFGIYEIIVLIFAFSLQ